MADESGSRAPLANVADRIHRGDGKQFWLEPSVWGGPVAWVVVAAVLLVLGAPARQSLAFVHADIANGQWWRLLTGNFVHLGFWHLFLDVLGLLVWVFLCGTRVGWKGWCLRTVVLALGVGVGLYVFVPSVAGYVGLSGMVYGLLVLDLGRATLVGRDVFAGLCVVVIAARVAWAMVSGTPTWERHLIGGEVIVAAHVCGMVTAAIYIGAELLLRRRRRWAQMDGASSAPQATLDRRRNDCS